MTEDVDADDDHQEEPAEGDVVMEPLSGGVVIKIYGEKKAWLYSTESITLNRVR